MGTWDTGIFDNDEALDLIGEIMDDLQGRIDQFFEDDDPSIEDGEGLVPPVIAVMQLLSVNCNAAPPKPDLIARWKTKYLKLFDDQIDDLEPEDGFKTGRREVLARAFKQLETTSKSFWTNGSESGGASVMVAQPKSSKADQEDDEENDEENDEDDEDDDVVMKRTTTPTSAAPAMETSFPKRRFEFSDGKSNKYWEIQLIGKAFTVTFGRIGTAGQTQTKDWPSEDKAKLEYQKLIDEKLKKGYEEIE